MAEITPVLTRHIVAGQPPLDLAGYREVGGYAGATRAIESISPEDLREMVTASNLRGRGGAGFPTGVKWGFVPQGEGSPSPKYVIANGDEMEPGTFKDRLLIHGNPHQLVEAMIISGWAVQMGAMMSNLRVAVIGAGYLGRYHAQKYAAMPGVDLVGVVDIEEAKAREILAAIRPGAG